MGTAHTSSPIFPLPVLPPTPRLPMTPSPEHRWYASQPPPFPLAHRKSHPYSLTPYSPDMASSITPLSQATTPSNYLHSALVLLIPSLPFTLYLPPIPPHNHFPSSSPIDKIIHGLAIKCYSSVVPNLYWQEDTFLPPKLLGAPCSGQVVGWVGPYIGPIPTLFSESRKSWE